MEWSFDLTPFFCLIDLVYSDYPLFSEFSNQVLCSCIISMSALSIIKELLDFMMLYGIIRDSVIQTVGFIVRLAIKLVIFLYLSIFYIWSFERSTIYWHGFLLVAIVYLIPQVISMICQLFPSISSFTRVAKYVTMHHPR